MITIELVRSIHDGHACEPQVVVRVIGDGREVRVEGPEPEIVDPTQPVLNLRNGRTIVRDDDPEEWVRGLAMAFRTPYLSARIIEDTNPVSDAQIVRTAIKEPVFR